MSSFPTGWMTASIEDLMERIIDYRGKTPSKTDSGIPLITAKIIKEGRIGEPTEFIAHETYSPWMRRGLPQRGDVLITTEAPLGEVAQIFNEKVALAQRVILLRGKAEELNNSYLKYVLQSKDVQKQLITKSTGTTVLGIKQSELRKVLIPLPPLEEQRRIAAILDKADAVRRKRKEAIALTEELLRSAFLEMFGDPVTNPKGWSTVPFSQLVQGEMRNGLSPSNKGTYRGQVLTLSAITQGSFNSSERKTAEFDVPPPKDKMIRKSDLLVCRGNGNINLVGCARFPDTDYNDVMFPDTIIGVPINSSLVNSNYLETLWNGSSVRRQIEQQARTTNGTQKINQKVLNNIQILLPPMALQEKFGAFCHSVKTVSARFADSAPNDLFNSLLQSAFRGEL